MKMVGEKKKRGGGGGGGVERGHMSYVILGKIFLHKWI